MNAAPRFSVAPAAPRFVGPRFTGGVPHARPYGRFRHYRSVGLLAPLFIAGAYYYPYRYLPYDGPVCGGITENGCQLQWTEVPLEDSDETAPQCVEFCPQQ